MIERCVCFSLSLSPLHYLSVTRRAVHGLIASRKKSYLSTAKHPLEYRQDLLPYFNLDSVSLFI